MTYIFKGMDIVLPSGRHVKFNEFIYDGNIKVGWTDMDGNKYSMSDLYSERCNPSYC